MRRMIRLGTAICVGVAVLAGCGSGPYQATSAAIVGQTGIPLSTTQDRITRLLIEPSQAAAGQPSDVAREVVGNSVIYALAKEAARRQGITVQPAQVDAALAAEPPSGGPPETPEAARERGYAELVMADLARRELDRLVVSLDATIVQSRAQAQRLAELAVRRDPAADQMFDAGGSSGVLAKAGEVAAANPIAATAVWFGTPAQRVLYFQPDPGSGAWVVVRVRDRRLVTPAAATPSVAARLDPTSLQLIGRRLLQPLAEELAVRVNPRYGVWDPLVMRVVPEDAATGTILVVPAG